MRRRPQVVAVTPGWPGWSACALVLVGGFVLNGCAADGGAGRPTRPLSGNLAGAAPAELAFDGDPEGLIGREAGEIRSALGLPQFVRRDAPAEIWQYRGAECVLDLFLYKEAGGLRVVYLEARDREAQTVPARPCFASVLAAQRTT